MISGINLGHLEHFLGAKKMLQGAIYPLKIIFFANLDAVPNLGDVKHAIERLGPLTPQTFPQQGFCQK
jgi:hypothetical protein